MPASFFSVRVLDSLPVLLVLLALPARRRRARALRRSHHARIGITDDDLGTPVFPAPEACVIVGQRILFAV